MQNIYYKDADGKEISVEVTDEVAAAYRESRREEWRGNARERYHTISLDAATDAGHEFEDESASIDVLTREEDDAARQALLRKLKEAVAHLTPLQRVTLHKLYAPHMSQAEISREEDVIESVISRRISRIYARLKKFLEKMKNFSEKVGKKQPHFLC